MEKPLRDRVPTKEWRRRPAPPAGFAGTLGVSPFQANLLYNRGVETPEDVEPFLAADSRLTSDPFLLPDMDIAVARLQTAVASGETIGVFGDFDTDGVAGTAILLSALHEIGARAVSYIPDRADEGHGLSSAAIERLHGQGVTLLVTVDCGTGSKEEIGQASLLGIDTVVTDHHVSPPAGPSAVAVVNPMRPDSTYPYRGLTGTGLAFKYAEALFATLGRTLPDHLMELAALGTVADMGPMTGENRFLVREGLRRLNGTQHPGLKALIARSGMGSRSIDTEALSFGLIPRLNAAGRLGSASVSLELLTTSSEEVAASIAERLELLNEQRRRLTEIALEEAHRQAVGMREEGLPVLVVEHSDWIPGILGLIASSLCDRYGGPVIAVRVEEQVSRASARSSQGYDILGLLGNVEHYFQRSGGHAQAAGFAVSTGDLPSMKRELMAAAIEIPQIDHAPRIDIDCEIDPALLNEENNGFIESLSPYGADNPAPVFLTRRARIADARRVGSDGGHLKMRISHSGRTWGAIAFKQGKKPASAGDTVDLVYTAGMNEWGGRSELQLNVLDFRTGG